MAIPARGRSDRVSRWHTVHRRPAHADRVNRGSRNMTKYSDTYQDELGVAWCATDLNLSTIASRLKVRLRRQSRWITAGLAIGLPLCAAGILLGVTSIGVGGISAQWNFVSRGIAWFGMSAILACALASLLDVRSESTASELSAMIDLANDR